MNSEERKKAIYNTLLESENPITGTELAEKYGVTRQIIVQDIALLRAEKKEEIISTARGYILYKKPDERLRKEITVCHGVDQIEDELSIIVDLGGRAITTYIDHPAYGRIGEGLNVKSRKDIKNFMKSLETTNCQPLLTLTNGVHKHVIEADSPEILKEICDELKSAGYLISD